MEVETRALAQMERLRPHQLVQADLVTEGMNRLAQALISLTDEVNRSSTPVKAEASLSELVLDADRLPGAKPGSNLLEAEVISTAPKLAERVAKKPRKHLLPKSKPLTKSSRINLRNCSTSRWWIFPLSTLCQPVRFTFQTNAARPTRDW
jgi:hypothetical protein